MKRIPLLVVAIVLAVKSLACGGPAQGSIGAVLGRNTDTGAVHVREVPKGLTGARAGLMPGDRIKMVDGVLLDALAAAEIQRMLRGPIDSTVTLTVIRGQEVLQLSVVRRPLGEAPKMQPAEERIE